MKPTLILIGGGGHCRSLIDVIEAQGVFSIAGILDSKERIGEKVLGYEIIGCNDDIERLYGEYEYCMIAFGQIRSPDHRITMFERLKNAGYILPTIISPRAYVSQHAQLGAGTVIMHDALINANAIIGENCIINTKALIEHDAIIQNHCHISTGAIINGATIVQEGTFFGSNAVSKEAHVINKRSFIKAGSIVK
jgi:sugar O-acyltransferase (sialic acid O-acetyltransferase NeuD family)